MFSHYNYRCIERFASVRSHNPFKSLFNLYPQYRAYDSFMARAVKGVNMEEKDVLTITQQLIQTPSLSGEEKDMAFLIRDLLSEIGMDSVHIDSYGNVITEVKGEGDYTVMLEGHMDHVPPGNEALWDHPPYSAYQTGDKIFGRGAVDMKGALASMVTALGHISRKERSISVMGAFVVHEETVEGTAIQRIIEERKIKPDLVILRSEERR